MNFNGLPSLVALAILVVVFRAILLEGAPEWLQLWLTGWILVLIHFVARFFDVGHGLWDQVSSAISWGALELASISFLISLSPRATDGRRQLLLGAVLGLPALAYTTAVFWGVTGHSFYYGVVTAAFVATSWLAWTWYHRTASYLSGLLVASATFSAVLVLAIAHNRAYLGINVILAGLNFVVAFLYWRRFQPATAGVLTTVFGFIAWGSVFPIGMFLELYSPSTIVESEIWHIPMYFVAVGMLLTLLLQLVEQLTAAVEADLPALIAHGESDSLEFKSSFRWDLRENKVNRALETVVLKTLAGFMNREGGTLLIGVADDGGIVGLEHDYKTLKKPDRDGFKQALMTAIATHLGADICYSAQVVLSSLENRDVCRVLVSPTRRPVYLKDGDSPRFYLRMGVITRELNVQEAVNYISTRWLK